MDTHEILTNQARIVGRFVGCSVIAILALGILTAVSLLISAIVWSWS